MSRYRTLIRSAIEAIQVDFPAAFSWFGKRYTCTPGELAEHLEQEQRAGLLLLSLQDLLYRQFYCSGGVIYHAAGWDSVTISRGVGGFVTHLVEANTGRGASDAGWHVCALDSEGVGLSKDGLTVHVRREMCRFERGSRIALGSPAALRQPNGSFSFSPGFYLVHGEEPFESDTGGGLIRIYWNINSDGAADLIRAVTRRLNTARMVFRLKLLDDPRRYTRCDAAVLYLPKTSYRVFASEHLRPIHTRIAHHLKPEVPALTKRVCVGVGIAEEPRRDRSFGSDRCRVLAAAIISASRARRQSLAHRLAHVEERFRENDIDPNAPYLNAGSRDIYDVMELPLRAQRASMSATESSAASRHRRYVAAAHRIGRLIASTAIWHEGECNWVAGLGPSPQGTAFRFGTLGPDLYDGTAGIALFLGRLYEATRDAALRDVALGAIEHAVAETDRAGNAKCGLYVGRLGVAVVAAQLGVLLEREDLLVKARQLARTGRPNVGSFDLIAGAAGRIIGLLILADILEDEWSVEASYAAGKQLVADANRSRRGISWNTGKHRGLRDLTGLSHGTAGVAYSLLELFSVSREEQFKVTAEAAVDYERSYFNPREGNWPDLREVDHHRRQHLTRMPYSVTWCHGAPGIALSRIRAAEVVGGDRYVGEARVAIDTTCRYVKSWVQSGHANYSLCHGIAGNADILLSAVRSNILSDSVAEGVIADAAELGLRAYGGDPSRWPCGVGSGAANPSLMVGWAGIGHFYLRLTQKALATPLAPRGAMNDASSWR
jgi:hypothetical protein